MSKRKMIEVVSCTDGMRWYAGHVGETFPLLREFADELKTREPAGYTNFVLRKDARIIEIDDESGA